MCIDEKEFVQVKNDVAALRKQVLGNGCPEDSLLWLIKQLAVDFKKHMEFHKSAETKIWDIIRPILILLSGGTVGAAIMYLASH